MPKFLNIWNQFWTKLPTAYRGAIIIGLPVIAILPAIVSWDWSNRAKANANSQVDRTQEVIRESNVLIGQLVDAETGIRGYVITQNIEFLEPYNRAAKEIPKCLQELEKLTQNNLPQQQQLQQIENQIEIILNLLAQILNTVETSEVKQTPQLTTLFTTGKAEMDKIRDSIDIFKAEEWKLLNIQQQHLEQINHTTSVLQGLTICFCLLNYGLAIRLYYQAEKELEARVQELALSNKRLAATNQLVKERNQELDQFSYVVSHDLKAPLRAISNLSKWIEEDLDGKLELETHKNMVLLRNRVQRMNSFIDGLLEYSRVGKVKGEKSIVDVHQLLLDIVDSIAPPPNFIIEIDTRMPQLTTEPILLQQVFSNLISNAIKHHHHDHGTVKISVEEQEDYYQFLVADNGRGIAAEHQAKIFDIFQTLTEKDHQENTGIGLSIVKKIIVKQQGKIWLESELGKGTKFFFTWNKV